MTEEEEIRAAFICVDCSFDTFQGDEYYMVHDHLWQAAGMGHGMLCIGCLESRLGRTLVSEDFTNYPINRMPGWNRSARLVDRLMDLSPVRDSILLCR